MHAVPSRLHAMFPLPWLHHPTLPLLSPVHHIPSPVLSPVLSHDPSPDSSPIVPYTTPAHPVTCYACHSPMMHATMGSAWLFANLSSNCSHVARQALPVIVATCFGVVRESFYMPQYFLWYAIFHFANIPYMFCPPSIRLSYCMQTFLENSYIQLWLNWV